MQGLGMRRDGLRRGRWGLLMVCVPALLMMGAAGGAQQIPVTGYPRPVPSAPSVPSVQTAAGQLPAQQPTRMAAPSAVQSTGTQPAYPLTPLRKKTRARVTYLGQMLTVAADNSSLNGILAEVARQTGMQITGGVSEEAVYGTYGPADAASVLSQLLAGTGSNMLLKMGARDQPVELVLTPRGGGASLPGPASFAPPPQEEAQPVAAQNRDNDPVPQQTMPPPPPTQVQAAAAAMGQSGSGGSSSSGADAGTNSTSAAKTPQQIYEELMKLQQSKPK